MSIVSTDLVLWSSANIPVDEVSTAGGAISTTTKPTLDQFTSNAIAQVVSDGADTRTVTVTGRLATGVVDTEVLTLNGTTPVSGAKTWERLLSVVLSATSGTRTVQVKQGAGGTVRATVGLNETTYHIAFQQSFSSTSIKNYFEKYFFKNQNGTLTLTSAAIKLTADPSAVITVGCAPTKGDSATVSNRLAAPASVTFVDDNVSQSVPTGTLAASETIGVWADMTLAANNVALRSSYTIQLSGTTT